MARTVGRYSPLLGTVVEIRVDARHPRPLEDAVVAELVRLEAVFSVFRSDSELSRWRTGSVTASGNLVAVLAEAERLYRCSGGAFHPAAGGLRERWLRAEATGAVPSQDEMAARAAATPLPFRVRDGRVEQTADCSGVDLNAIAKGYCVDRALAAGLALDPSAALVVNAGGDLAHRGSPGVRVGVEDPLDAVDNARPLARVHVMNRALATSGRSRRGFRVGGTWFGHVIDPRTGWPRDEIASASVLAPSTLAADGLATVIAVAGPAAAVACAAEGPIDWLVVDARGQVTVPTGTAFEVLAESGEQERRDPGDAADRQERQRRPAAARNEDAEQQSRQCHQGQDDGSKVDREPPDV